MKKVLILGAGMVVKPMVEYLIHHGYEVTVASRTKSKADLLIQGHPLGKAIGWTVDQEDILDQMVEEHNLTVSLLPYAYHAMVAKHCLKHKKNMVTTSYVQAEMSAMDQEARDAGILLLNEIGVDPGIDHMSAMKIIDHVHDKGGKILSFFSITGALPAPEATDNPFRYKFSWSPKGVVMAGNNDGRFLLDGKEKYVPTADLFKQIFSVHFPDIGTLEVYPNRDSVQYIDIYNLQEVKTIFRGTFRYPNWCRILDAMKTLRLISYDKLNLKGKTFSGMIALLMGSKDTADIRKQVAKYLSVDEQDIILEALEWLGLFSSEEIGREEDSAFEVVSDLMIKKMMLGEDERDMIVMQHSFLASYPDSKKEVIHSRMLDFGSPKSNTAVARTVALPAAIAVRLILEEKIKITGVYRPVIPEIYLPVLEELENMGIRLTEEFGLPLSALPSF
ncbi:MAG: saccharopine dehydrogenase [Chlorobi bacterium]|nr:saccharopine dehydrogenase [Chlorobiota bacterium]